MHIMSSLEDGNGPSKGEIKIKVSNPLDGAKLLLVSSKGLRKLESSWLTAFIIQEQETNGTKAASTPSEFGLMGVTDSVPC